MAAVQKHCLQSQTSSQFTQTGEHHRGKGLVQTALWLGGRQVLPSQHSLAFKLDQAEEVLGEQGCSW